MLTTEPMHAYRMQKLIKQWGKDKVVNVRQRASVYQALERLLRLGLIKVRETVQSETRPDRTIYAITKLGRATATEWLREMLTAVGEDFPEFPAALSMLVMLKPADSRKQLEIRVKAIREELKKLEEDRRAAGDLPRLFLLEDEYRAALLKSELKWLEAVIADLRKGSLRWNEPWRRAVAAKHSPKEKEDNDDNSNAT